MFRSILVPLDGSEQAARALGPAVEAAKIGDGRVLLLRVVRPVEQFTKEEALPPLTGARSANDVALSEYEARKSDATSYLSILREQLSVGPVEIEIRITEGTPAGEILRNAKTWGADLIVLTPHGLGATLVPPSMGLFGSVADAVLRGAELPVLVVKP
jgi:nucleotide-binding universal stress UspA family protein